MKGGKRRYFLQLLGIGAQKKGSKGRQAEREEAGRRPLRNDGL